MTGPVVLPELVWEPTQAYSDRRGSAIRLVVIHRWGVAYRDPAGTAASYRGVVNYFKNTANQVSAHVVYPGTAVPGEASQMVAWADAAWTEAAYNREGVSIESADAIWLGHDPAGFHQLARMAAGLLHYNDLPCAWSTDYGFCRHGDLGAAGGGHTSCPTTDLNLWRAFSSLVHFEYQRGGFRPVWGKETP